MATSNTSTHSPTWWDRFAAAVSGRRSWWIALAVILISGAAMGLIGENDSGDQAPDSLPTSADSAQVSELLDSFPDSDVTAAVLVAVRSDGAPLSDDDKAAVEQALQRMLTVDRSVPTTASAGPGAVVSPDGIAAISVVPVSADLNGFKLTDLVDELRDAADDGLPSGLTTYVTGGPAFGADTANSFSGANVTLLAVTALVVALLLIVTYRSPVLWLVPLLVIGFADRLASSVGTGLAELTGLSFDGSTSGITSVLVFGAGTNYALLLISRYREELRKEQDHRIALQHAVRHSGPAILASNATVVLALLTLLLAALPSTRSLGALAAAGLVVAVIFALLVLPPLLALFGTRLFWPFIPKVGDPVPTEGGNWFKIANAVSRHPVRVLAVALTALVACSLGLLSANIGLSQTEQFRVSADSVEGFDTLAEHFPAGQSDPTIVIANTAAAEEIQSVLDSTDGVISATETGRSDNGLTKWSVVIDADPASEPAFDIIDQLRDATGGVPDAEALVGGSDAKALDIANASERDRLLIIPLILAVVFVILIAFLRALVAPVVLVATTVLSTVAAIGIGSLISEHIFGFPALDNNVPLYAFLFLVALGIDYTMFLVIRAREETPGHGTRDAIVRAVASTGAVITSAGIVLAAVFCVLGILPLITLTQLGIIVGLGILLDTFLVRTVVIPALFSVIGPRIWWPGTVDRKARPLPELQQQK
ncbi:MMPL family transporter [Williamsia muralis]|uniref:MMPL family transporter n=1 Tax=Williamsia marianensis TaxID=85044 RepID=UPI0016709BDF|nr:MMPL family transporter [Williamsia marianensis]